MDIPRLCTDTLYFTHVVDCVVTNYNIHVTQTLTFFDESHDWHDMREYQLPLFAISPPIYRGNGNNFSFGNTLTSPDNNTYNVSTQQLSFFNIRWYATLLNWFVALDTLHGWGLAPQFKVLDGLLNSINLTFENWTSGSYAAVGYPLHVQNLITQVRTFIENVCHTHFGLELTNNWLWNNADAMFSGPNFKIAGYNSVADDNFNGSLTVVTSITENYFKTRDINWTDPTLLGQYGKWSFIDFWRIFPIEYQIVNITQTALTLGGFTVLKSYPTLGLGVYTITTLSTGTHVSVQTGSQLPSHNLRQTSAHTVNLPPLTSLPGTITLVDVVAQECIWTNGKSLKDFLGLSILPTTFSRTITFPGGPIVGITDNYSDGLPAFLGGRHTSSTAMTFDLVLYINSTNYVPRKNLNDQTTIPVGIVPVTKGTPYHIGSETAKGTEVCRVTLGYNATTFAFNATAINTYAPANKTIVLTLCIENIQLNHPDWKPADLGYDPSDPLTSAKTFITTQTITLFPPDLPATPWNTPFFCLFFFPFWTSNWNYGPKESPVTQIGYDAYQRSFFV